MKKISFFLIVFFFLFNLSAQIIADYKFSGNADDISGNNNNGTVFGATLTTDRYGNDNSAYSFDGYNDYIDLNSALLPTDGSDFSFSLWYEAENENDGALKNILAQYEWTEGRFHIFEYNNQLTVFSSSMEHGYSIADITEDWNNVIVTCSNSILSIYLNCELVAENILIDPILNTNTLIGDDGSTSPNRFFNGKIDDIRVYSYVLSYEEIHQLCEQDNDNCLIADYKFTGNADDISGNNNNGTVFGASLTTDRFGNDNSAYYFDGVNDYINIPQSTPFNFGEGDFAISTWVKTTNSTSAGMIFQKGSTSEYQGPQFWLRSPDNWLNHNLVFLTSDSNPPSPYTSVDSIEIADGNWHHIVAQRNGSFLELYFDGFLVSSSITEFKNIDDDIGAIIGAQHPHPGNYEMHNFFSGSIDDIKLYQCALTVEEIQELFEPEVQCLVADYPFSGNADDISGNNNNGIVFGPTLTTDRFGNDNSAYYFDGVDDYIEIIPESSVDNINNFTLTAWVYLEDWNEQPGINSSNLDRQYIFDGHSHSSTTYNDFFRDGFYMAYNLSYRNNESLMCGFWENYSSYPRYNDINDIQNWHFVSYSRNDDTTKYYINGVRVNTELINNHSLNMNHKWFIGTFSGNNNYYDSFNYNFHGKIDDIKIYQCALSDDEIQELYEPEVQCIVADYTFTGNADDISGNNINGTVFGATLTTDRHGNDNSAYYFDGVDDYIDVPQSTSFNFGEGDFAISTWVKTTNSTFAGMIFQKGSTSAYQGPQFWLRSPDSWLNHNLVFLTSDSNPPSPYTSVDSIEIADGNWHHIVAQRKGSFLELYFDGFLVSSSFTRFKNIDDNIGAIIGAQHPHPGNYELHNFFWGSIDDIKIYQCALSDEEIYELCSDIQNIVNDESAVKLYPNPTNGSITVATENYNNIISEIQIYDITGKLVLSKNINSNIKKIDISELPQTIYLIKIKIGDSFVTKKFFKYTE